MRDPAHAHVGVAVVEHAVVVAVEAGEGLDKHISKITAAIDVAGTLSIEIDLVLPVNEAPDNVVSAVARVSLRVVEGCRVEELAPS